MNLAVKKSTASAVTSTVTAAVDALKAKHKEEIFALQKIIEKSLLLRKALFAILFLDSAATSKIYPGTNSLPKTTTERLNQANLGYFNSYLDRAYKEGEIVLVRKNVYY